MRPRPLNPPLSHYELTGEMDKSLETLEVGNGTRTHVNDVGRWYNICSVHVEGIYEWCFIFYQPSAIRRTYLYHMHHLFPHLL